jgi:hypothetical protein
MASSAIKDDKKMDEASVKEKEEEEEEEEEKDNEETKKKLKDKIFERILFVLKKLKILLRLVLSLTSLTLVLGFFILMYKNLNNGFNLMLHESSGIFKKLLLMINKIPFEIMSMIVFLLIMTITINTAFEVLLYCVLGSLTFWYGMQQASPIRRHTCMITGSLIILFGALYTGLLDSYIPSVMVPALNFLSMVILGLYLVAYFGKGGSVARASFDSEKVLTELETMNKKGIEARGSDHPVSILAKKD